MERQKGATKLNDITLSSRQLADVALSTIRSVIGAERYQYLSGPITGGRRLLAWHASTGRELPDDARSAARRAAVTSVNIVEIKAEATRQRALGRSTIEPGSFEAEFKQWGQPEFYAFWDRVLEEHADCAIFIDGWEFSAGCTFEYLRARHHGLPTLDIRGADLPVSRTLELLAASIAEIARSHDAADPRDEAIARLQTSINGYKDEIAQLP